ncbi:MAG TPA: tannase/feruloyl esterase family alpha/beta hydrolase, partial [Vicinamibacterales bacterium]|nr:tannase/feruloyl esterase family alpha/beta hydrolase [Vicinamibacterales bacterium]
NTPAFCRVAATLSPVADSEIKVEVWLPAAWNNKYQAVGNGGWAGAISYPAMAAAVNAGYATASTDTGHAGGTGDFALNHPEKLKDFGYRAIHETTVFAKQVIDRFYGAAPAISYFNGCSTGGRQAITEAQRYPADFTGIVAGASAWDGMRMHASRVAMNLQINKNADGVIPSAKLPMIHAAVLEACDALDGVKDGVIENPMKCKYDYAQLACKGADGPDCLTPAQVATAKILTSPLTDPASGKVLDERHLWPGAELGFSNLGGASPLGLSVSGLKNVAFKDPNYDYKTFNAARDWEMVARSDEGAVFSGDPNLKPFFDRGGKLLMYHGWTDQQVTPQESTIYYDNVVKKVGKDAAAKGIALFMIPGMNHCQGGAGTDTFDKMGTIERWVASGKAPAQIVASHATQGKIDRTRPLCRYPQVAKYNGTGSTDEAANFSCVNP